MRIGRYELRKPWIKYVDYPIEETLYYAIRSSIGNEIAQEIEALIDNQLNLIPENNLIRKCARIARGQK